MYAADAVLLRRLCKGSLQLSKAVKKLAVIDNEDSVINNESTSRTVNAIIVGDAQQTEIVKGVTC